MPSSSMQNERVLSSGQKGKLPFTQPISNQHVTLPEDRVKGFKQLLQSWTYLDNSIVGFMWINTTLIYEEYDTPVKVPHGVVQCRYLGVLNFGV